MRYLLLLLLITACTPQETGEVRVLTCPSCYDAYNGFSTCAFFDAQPPYSRPEMLVDDENFHGIGTPIKQDGYMHHKFCFNGTHTVYGSANPTATGLGANDNYIIQIESKTLSDAFEAEYNYLQGKGSGKHKTDWMFNNKKLEVLFCPRDNCENRITQVLSTANDSIHFAAFSFTSRPIAETLIAAKMRGVHVTGVMEPLGKSRGQYQNLLDEDIPITIRDAPGLMHAKLFLVDETIAITGSYNPSQAANTKNAETVVITREPEIIQTLVDFHSTLR